ncbi:MAG: DUF2062 domain-containing protein [Gammaproteobacteria bacterium]
MFERFRRFMPEPHAVREHRALRWLAPFLHHPRLWHVNRRGIAMGLAIGVFFGLLIPIAQIPAAVLVAFLLRANIPAAVGSTLVTNPFTFAPVYYAAYHLGVWMLGERAQAVNHESLQEVATQTATGLALWMDKLTVVGAPLALGLLTLAVTISLIIYFAVHWTWRVRIVRAWRQRRARRRPPSDA